MNRFCAPVEKHFLYKEINNKKTAIRSLRKVHMMQNCVRKKYRNKYIIKKKNMVNIKKMHFSMNFFKKIQKKI